MDGVPAFWRTSIVRSLTTPTVSASAAWAAFAAFVAVVAWAALPAVVAFVAVSAPAALGTLPNEASFTSTPRTSLSRMSALPTWPLRMSLPRIVLFLISRLSMKPGGDAV